MTISGGGFVVTDTNNTVIFKVEGKLMTFHDQRVLLDADGMPIVTLRQKRMTAHHRWNVYRGKSKEPGDLIFSVQRSSMIQLKAKLHVFLANNTEKKVCDFMVEGTWAEKTCVVYTGDRTNILAKMEKETTIGNALIGKDKYSVTVCRNVDYAFIVALIVILDDMNHISDRDELAINIGKTMVGLPPTLAGLPPTLADFGADFGLQTLVQQQIDDEEQEKDEDVQKTNDEVQEKEIEENENEN
ncbi:hypothetical protein I3843_10G154800 [Carya illinoinensis]|nr:hypothetical protein CIPAW_10G163000 [Carya illinoinensis]KAG7960958.1 hypothetical protein I3843_10G154800 [Carya illinoinensis]